MIEDVIGDDGTELTDTLLSGQTTITFTSEEITNDSKLNAVYTSIFDVPLESATFEDGTLTLVFPAQEEDMTVVALINATSTGDDIIAREVSDELNAHVEDTDNPHGVIASQIGIDNSGNGMNASDVQEAIDEVSRMIGIGKKNLLPYPYHSLTAAPNGVTWTDNKGVVTANGLATSDSYVQCSVNDLVLKAGTYRLSGCPKGGSDSTYWIVVYYINSELGRNEYVFEYGEGTEFTIDKTRTISLDLVIKQGYTANNLTFYPMISVEGGEYVPYVADVQTQINTLKTVENILQTKQLDFTNQYTDVYTYTATRKCIISLSCTALYNTTVPHAVQITDGINMLVNNSVNSTDDDIPGSISASQTLMLNVGDTIKAQVKYKTAGKNNITYCGCIQYLE